MFFDVKYMNNILENLEDLLNIYYYKSRER